MIEYLYLLCLLSLTVSVPILIRGCFKINEAIPNQGGAITESISNIHGLIDELNDLISEVADGFDSVGSQLPQTPPDFMSLLTAFLNRDRTMTSNYGTTQQEEREVYEIDPTQTQQTETILDEYSPVNPSG